MGIIISSLGDYWDTHLMMTAQQEIHFRFDYLSNLQRAQAWGQMQAQAQAGTLGLAYAGTGATAAMGTGAGRGFGYGYGFWQSVNNALYGLGFFMIALGAMTTAVGVFMNLEPEVLFGSLWIFLSFFSHHIMFNTHFGQTQLMYGTLPMWAIVGGGVVAGVLGFGVYNAYRDAEETQVTRMAIGVASGLVAVAFLSLGGMHMTRRGPKQPARGAGAGAAAGLPCAGVVPQHAVM